jgi:outer membrane immunogenic protein
MRHPNRRRVGTAISLVEMAAALWWGSVVALGERLEMNSQHRDMHMRKLLLTTAALVALTAGEGFGADLPRSVMKAPPAPLPVTSWSGCYVAGGGGYGFWNQDTSLSNRGTLVGSEVTSGGRGWFGTVGGGCDLQVSGSWVIGVFGNYDFASIRGDVAVPADGVITGHEKLTSAWAVGGRIGYLITPSILTYVSGGYTEARFSGADLFALNSVPAHTFSGWFLGGGYEYNLSLLPGLFWRTEYRLAEYNRGGRAFLQDGIPDPGFSVDSKPFVQTIRSELVWRLNWGR